MINDRFLYIGDLFVIYYNLWIRKRTRIIHPSRLYILTYLAKSQEYPHLNSVYQYCIRLSSCELIH